MKNYLIKLLGGVTSIEFSEIFSLAAKDREVMQLAQEFYKTQCELRQKRIDYLEDLIFTKTGFVATSLATTVDAQEFQPISGRNNWKSIEAEMKRKDHEIMVERHKNAR